ncbi:MAG: sulfatase-like hydrolase/transferase, partial [Cereibacter sp.]
FDRFTQGLIRPGLLAAGLALAAAGGAAAQQSPAPLGSPAATRVIDGLQLPAPGVPFGGKIERNALQSTPFWQPRITPPEGAPNVLLILTDDVGFGAPSTFGGVIPTPALDRIAEMGLRYTNMHSTALCSPTRAALLTGRNHHSAGFGVISEQATGFPGYDSIITKDKATIGRVLSDNGYNTSWFGKNHNTPGFQISMMGPFDPGPTGMGFASFSGFMGGDTSQWTPGNLFRNTTQIYPSQTQKGFNLITAMADEAIDYLAQLDTLAPDQPWFVYYAPGGTHAPHHPTPEWIKKISDMKLFDEGWNKLRDTIFANQKRLGVIPETAELTAWPSDLLKDWDKLTADEQKMFIRQANVYAAYLAYTDAEIGRVIDAVEANGDLDNTLII